MHRRGLFELLPPELVPEILGYLDQADLWSVAAVSRIFYDSAWRAGLYLHLNLEWHSLRCVPDGLTAVKEVVTHVQRKGLWLSISADFQTCGVGARLHEAINSRAAHDILDILSSALPVLVYLVAYTAGNFFPTLAAALRHPVLNLAFLELGVDQVQGVPGVHRVPVDLFMGSAPKLRRIVLKDIPLGPDPIPAFARVDTLTLDYAEVYPDIAYASHFRHLRSLHLNFYTDEETPPPRSFRLGGVRLRKLTLGDCYPLTLIPSIQSSMRLEDVAHVVLIGGPERDWSDPIWKRQDDGLVSIRLMHTVLKKQLEIVVVPEHHRWRRDFHRDMWSIHDSFPLLGLPALSARLAYLRIENAHIAALLKCRDLALPRLRALRVDVHAAGGRYAAMVWPPDWLVPPGDDAFSFATPQAPDTAFTTSSYASVDCSALQHLTLFAMDAVLRVRSPEVAFLGRALSQCTRQKTARAALMLIGVGLTIDNHPLLDEAFSAVCRQDFAGEDSFVGRDAGLWEDDSD